MSETTGIAWTDHTFNPWWGCVRVSPACEACYAEAFAKRTGHHVWGPKSERRFFGDKHWAEPLKWNREAQRNRRPARVFCASMADVFEERAELREPRRRLFDLIEQTTALQWQLLTKRPENVRSMVPSAWLDGFPENVWMGTTVESRHYYRRIYSLEMIPARVRFLSCEPLLEALPDLPLHNIDWVIVGGESGSPVRRMEIDWLEDVAEQAQLVLCPVFVKQDSGRHPGKQGRIPDYLWALKDFPHV